MTMCACSGPYRKNRDHTVDNRIRVVKEMTTTSFITVCLYNDFLESSTAVKLDI